MYGFSIYCMYHIFPLDAMLCHPPKPGYVEALEDLEMRFRIESKPVVGLICLLIINGGLYLSIIPFAVSTELFSIYGNLYIDHAIHNNIIIIIPYTMEPRLTATPE